jgi:DNA polymerase III subunit epsilon
MTLAIRPDSTLVDRALFALGETARPASWLASNVLGLGRAPEIVAERLAAALLGADPRVQRRADGCWGLVSAACGAPLIEELAFAVVDVETTGVRATRDDRITEIAVVVVQGERCETVLDLLVNPGRPISGIVTSITGITNAMVRAAPRFEEIAERVTDALAGRIFVAHNARFDWRFVSAELKRCRGMALDGARLCTVRLARKLVDAVQSCSLDALTHRYGFENPARHRAGGDALVTALLLRRLLRLARENGARTLADLECLQGPNRKKPRKKGRRALPTWM